MKEIKTFVVTRDREKRLLKIIEKVRSINLVAPEKTIIKHIGNAIFTPKKFLSEDQFYKLFIQNNICLN